MEMAVSAQVKTEAALPSIAQVLELEEVRSGQPEVIVGAEWLSRRVRWIHIAEVPDLGPLLEGGELLLTSGLTMSSDESGVSRGIANLASFGAVGIIFELGRNFEDVPSSLAAACQKHKLPLIALHRKVRFVTITKRVHTLIIDEQAAALQASHLARETFTSMCLDGAAGKQIIEETSAMCDCPVVLENLLHQVLAFAPHGGERGLLERWEARSRAVVSGDRVTEPCGPERWICAPVNIRGRQFARLVILPRAQLGNRRLAMIASAAADAIGISTLVNSGREPSLQLQSQQDFFSKILDHRFDATAGADIHGSAIGFPTRNRVFIGLVVESRPEMSDEANELDADAIAASIESAGIPALVCPGQHGEVAVLLSLGCADERAVALARFARAVRKVDDQANGAALLIGAGSTVESLRGVSESVREAREAAVAARGAASEQLYYEVPDIQLRGLMYVLGNDVRLQSFVERTLGPLIEYDHRHDARLLDTLRVYLQCGGNKFKCAAAAHISRQTLYRQLATIQRTIAADLENPEIRTSLHAALLALDAQRNTSIAASPVSHRAHGLRLAYGADR